MGSLQFCPCPPRTGDIPGAVVGGWVRPWQWLTMDCAVQAVSALQEFLRSQDAVADTIRQADQSLSEHDKELAGETPPQHPRSHPPPALTQHMVPPRAAGTDRGGGA